MTDPRIRAAARALCIDRGICPDDNEEFGRHFGKEHNWQAYVYLVSIVLAAADAAAWRPMSEAPRDCVFLGLVDGHIRLVSYTKASHIRMHGFCLLDQGSEDIDICHPTHWQPLPAPPVNEVQR